MKGIKKIQDNEGNWYWIPKDQLKEFATYMLDLPEYYIDNPEMYDEFEDKFGIYRTSGDKNIKPDIFKNK